jgi:hypothetical protein
MDGGGRWCFLVERERAREKKRLRGDEIKKGRSFSRVPAWIFSLAGLN